MPSPANSPQLERRAQWALERWTDDRTLGYYEMTAEIRKKFECGKTAAELTIKRTYELMKARTAEVVQRYLDTIVADTLDDIQAARRTKDYRAANKMRMDLARLLGIGEPERVDVTHHKFDELSDEELEALGKLDGAPTEH